MDTRLLVEKIKAYTVPFADFLTANANVVTNEEAEKAFDLLAALSLADAPVPTFRKEKSEKGLAFDWIVGSEVLMILVFQDHDFYAFGLSHFDGYGIETVDIDAMCFTLDETLLLPQVLLDIFKGFRKNIN